MKITRTRILLGLIVVSGASGTWAYSSCAAAKDDAQLKSETLQSIQRDIADLRAARGIIALTPTERADLSRRVRTAAATAQVSDQLLSIESGQESRDSGGATSHAPVYLRFGAVTLQQLDAFLTEMSTGESAAGVGEIDLSIPQGSDVEVKQNAESWSAEITLSQSVPTTAVSNSAVSNP